jgi:hypothetical protein
MTFPTDLPAALTTARIAVERHVRRADQIGITWQEETVSELIWVNTEVDGRIPIQVADFNKREEGGVGADWLWWFVDTTGECFGLLVQAKRLKQEKGVPGLALRYQSKGAALDQMTKLFRAAGTLQLPSAYALYFGAVDGRGLRCGPDHSSNCEPCRRKTVAILPGLRAQFLADDPIAAARDAFAECAALEDLVDATQDGGPAVYPGMSPLPDDLQQWMTERQVGARQVAKRVYQMIIRPDEVMLSADVADRLLMPTDAVFQDVPLDELHFGQPYFVHVLAGLRRQPPSYVLDIQAGESPSLGSEFNDIGGIVVVAI